MEGVFKKGGRPVSVIKVFVRDKSKAEDENVLGYSLDIECFDIFLTDFTKKQLEKLCAIILDSVSEIQIYRCIKEREPIIEFSASQLSPSRYKVSTATAFVEYIRSTRSFNSAVNLISKSIIERIIYLFTAYSLDSY